MRRLAPVIAILGLLACEDDPDPFVVPDADPADAVADATTHPDRGSVLPDAGAPPDSGPLPPTPDAGGPPPDTPIGQVNVVWYQEDKFFTFPDLHANAVFEPRIAELGVESGVGWLADRALLPGNEFNDGHWEIPLLGIWNYVESEILVDELAELDIRDAGHFVAVGAVVAHVSELIQESRGVSIYETLLEEGADFVLLQSPGDTLDLVIGGGEDIRAQRVDKAIQLPETVRVTSHDIFQTVPMRFGKPLSFSWRPTAAEDDTMLVGVLGENDGIVVHVLDDDGAIDLTPFIAEARLEIGATPTVFLSRTRQRKVQIAEGTVTIVASTRVNAYPEFVAPFEVSPRVLDRGETHVVEVRWWDDALDADDVAVTMAGLDVREVAVDLTGHVARVVVHVPGDAPLGPRAVTLRSGAVRVEAPEGLFVAADLPATGDCESVLDEGLVADGTYRGDFFGLGDSGYDTVSCLDFEYEGGDQAIPLRLRAGETLSARLVEEVLGTALHIVRDCADEAPPLACFGTIGFGQAQALEYTSAVSEDVLLVLDRARFFDEPEPFVVDIQRHGARDVVLQPTAGRSGAEVELLVTVTSPDHWDGEIEDVALGDAEILDLQAFGPVAFVTAALPDVDAPTTLTVEVVVDGEVVEQPDAFTIRSFLSPRTCADAEAGPPLGPGTYDGTTFGGEDEFNVFETCPFVHDGPEAWHRVELGAGETLLVKVEATLDDDPVLVFAPDCDDGELVCADFLAEGFGEFLRWTGPAEPSVVMVGVDAHEELELDYVLEIDILGPGEL